MLDKQYPTVHSGGINKDRLFQDKNDVTFALNSIRVNHEGGRAEYQSEPGNDISVSLPSGYLFLGSIYGQNEEVYIFSTNGINSEIGLFKNDTYQTLVNIECLNFNLNRPITGEYRVRNGCDRTIYWCDHFNPDYWYNIDRPEDFKTSGVFDCNKFKSVPTVLPIDIDLLDVNDFGGILSLGSYYFQPEILDEDLNTIHLGDITPQVIIYDDPQSGNYSNINGGLNIEQYDPLIGGVPVTNKSISLRFSNLNTSYSYLRINVFRAIAGTQVISGHSVGKLIEINNSIIDWTYQGYDVSSGDFPIDNSEKLIDNATYESAYVMEQVQGRLLKANLRESSIDYTSYQSYASKITAKWVSEEYRMQSIKTLGDSKNPKTYWYKRGHQGDEVYLPGIQFLHNSGIVSPVFPLVGRAPNSTDLEILTVVPNNAVLGPTDVWLSDVEHLGLDINAQVERWKVFNTATITSSQTTTTPYQFEGEFSYYESDSETYPDIKDCDDNLIWGNDADDNPILTTTKVRMFKFPDRRLLQHFDKRALRNYARPFGIKFDNISYPSSDVIGHRFVMAERTDFDKTVVDSGWSVTPNYEQYTPTGEFWVRLGRVTGKPSPNFTVSPDDKPDAFRHNYYDPATTQSHNLRFESTKVLYDNSVSSFSYYKTNKVHHFGTGIVSVNGILDYAKTEVKSVSPYDPAESIGVLHSIVRNMEYKASAVPTRTNHTEFETFLVPAKANTTATGLLPAISNDDLFTASSVSYIGYGLEDTTPLLGAQINNFPNPTQTRNTQFESHNFYTYKKAVIQPYTNILSRKYVSLHHNFTMSLNSADNVYYGGDCLIETNGSYRLAAYLQARESLTNLAIKSFAYTNLFNNHFEEVQINNVLRHEGTDPNNRYYKSYGINGDEYNYDKFSEVIDGERTLKVPGGQKTSGSYEFPDVEEEYYKYNRDYTIRFFDKVKSSLPSNFNYCSRCSNYYPTRLIWSPKSFDEELFDNYRINKVNDYIDLPAHRGAITGLSYQNNQLLVHTEDTTFILQPNPQQISTDQNTAYLTTGDFLSIPPQELLQTDVGTGGLQSKQSACNTPFGRVWVDQKRGEIFRWDGQIEMMSNQGLLQWCKEHVPSELNKEHFRVYGEDFPIKSTHTLNGIGILVYYDPRFKRVLITKKDYLPLDLRTTFIPSDPNAVIFGEIEGWQTKPSSTITNVFPTDPTFFENKSWTLSYSFLDQSWASWHSYIPWGAFADSNNFYTTALSSDIYKHLSKTKYQTYYGTKYDFIIEWMNTDLVTSNVSNLYYVGYSNIWDDVNKQFKTVDTTFNKLLMYNFEQSTGLQTLVYDTQHTASPYGNNSLSSSSKYIFRTDQNYKISGLYDMATNQPVITKAWGLKQFYPGYIDIVSNDTNINFNKSPYQWGNLWDKFVFIRLFYKPAEDHRKSVIVQVLNNHQSIR